MPRKTKPGEPSPFDGMTRAERARAIGRLGGIARALKLTKLQRQQIARKGGLMTYLQLGEEGYRIMARKHYDSLTEEQKEVLREKRRGWLAEARARRKPS